MSGTNILTLITDAMAHEAMVEGTADAGTVMKMPIEIHSRTHEWEILSIYTNEGRVIIDIGQIELGPNHA